MSNESTFQPLTLEALREYINSVEIAYDLIVLTLTDEATLVGAIAKHWHWDGKVISISFNTEDGKRFGYSHIVDIPVGLIADIQPIPLDKSSIPQIAEDDPQLAFVRELGLEDRKYARLPVQDYPNPLATIICKHNLQVATSHELPLYGYVERALSPDAIPPRGIQLERDFLLCVDWDFFSRQTSGGVSISGGLSAFFAEASVTKDMSPSLQEFVLKTVEDAWSERIRQGLSPRTLQGNVLQGHMLVPEPTEDTRIEGEKCIVTLCESHGEGADRVACPVLIKVRRVKLPLEFLGYVSSVLTFYGEFLPIPLSVMGSSFQSVLLARAIAYLDTK